VQGKDKNIIICQSCHKVHGAKGDKITIVDNASSRLCVICHEKQKSLINTKHDMRLLLPDIKNIKQQRVSQSGPCGACHTPHNAANKRLWARQLGSGDLATQMCLSCHGEKSGFDTKHIGNISHPVNDKPISDTSISDTLPLYTVGLTRSPNGRVQCFTCHEVHRWSPNASTDQGGKDIEGDGSNSFLRISSSVSSDLCLDCHKDKKQLMTSDHNLMVTAPGEKNMQGLTAEQSGPCGVCHVPHNASGVHLWAKTIPENKDIVTQLCVGCHNKNGSGKAKLIGNNYHPVNIEFKTLNSEEAGTKISTLLPFYDSVGNRMPDVKAQYRIAGLSIGLAGRSLRWPDPGWNAWRRFVYKLMKGRALQLLQRRRRQTLWEAFGSGRCVQAPGPVGHPHHMTGITVMLQQWSKYAPFG